MLLLVTFCYIAYIDIELVLKVFVTKEVVDESLYVAGLSDAENIDNAMTTIVRWLALDLFVGFLLVSALALWLAKHITKPIEKAVEFAEVISEGDLTHTVDNNRRDEIGTLLNSLNKMSTQLNSFVVEVNAAANEVAEEARHITAINDENKKEMSQQASRIDSIAKAIEQSSVAYADVANNSKKAVVKAQYSGNTANEGSCAVADTISGIESISDAVNLGVKSVNCLGERSNKINQIVHLIKEVADQTNLLALNAAIEAARAGEYGRGFAVVADEVRGLATKTTMAADDIAKSISESITDTNHAIEQMKSGSENVQLGAERAKKSGDVLENIIESSDNVIEMITAIAGSTEQQSQTASQMAEDIEQVAGNTEHTLGRCLQAYDAATLLNQKADSLKRHVSVFKI